MTNHKAAAAYVCGALGASATIFGATTGVRADTAHAAPSVSTDPAIDDVLKQIAALPDSGEIKAPLLWSTTLLQKGGSPAAGVQAVAYVVVHSDSAPTGDKSGSASIIPVAKATSDSAGNISLRLDPETVSRYIDPSGWLDITYRFDGRAGTAMWVDSTFAPQDYLTSGRWETTVAALEVDKGEASVDQDQLDALAAQELPTELVLGPSEAGAVNGGVKPSGVALGVTDPPTGCTVPNSWSDGIPRLVPLASALLGGELWTSTFLYQNSQTTSLSVGVSANFTLGTSTSNLGTLGIGGTKVVTTSQSNLTISEPVASPAGGGAVGRRYAVYFDYRTDLWKCTNGYPNSPYFYKVVNYPTKLRDDLGSELFTVSVPTNCTTDHYVVPSGQAYQRTSGSVSTAQSPVYSYTTPSVYSISFTVSGQTLHTNSTSNYQNWINAQAYARGLCGRTSSNLGANTEIVARK